MQLCRWLPRLKRIVNQHSPEGLIHKLGMQSLVYQQPQSKFGSSAKLTIQETEQVAAALGSS